MIRFLMTVTDRGVYVFEKSIQFVFIFSFKSGVSVCFGIMPKKETEQTSRRQQTLASS